jgi:hypothetical protein
MIYVARSSLEWKIFQAKSVEKIKTRILCSITFFFENSAVYEIIRKNIVEPGRPKMTIWRMRIVCWITKATNTLSEYVILVSFPLQQWLQESTSLFCYTYIDCLVIGYWKYRNRLNAGKNLTILLSSNFSFKIFRPLLNNVQLNNIRSLIIV